MLQARHILCLFEKVAELGLLSRLESAGLSLSTIVPLLKFANNNDLLGVLESSSADILPVIGAAVENLPVLLPVAQYALNMPPVVLPLIALASAAGTAAFVTVVPDDSVFSVTLQTIIAIPFGLVVPGIAGGAGVLLAKYKK